MTSHNYSFQLKHMENNIKNQKIDYDNASISLSNAKKEFNQAYIQLRDLYTIISPSFRAHNQEVVLNAFKKYEDELIIFERFRVALTQAEASFQNTSEKLDKENDDYQKVFHDFESQFHKIHI